MDLQKDGGGRKVNNNDLFEIGEMVGAANLDFTEDFSELPEAKDGLGMEKHRTVVVGQARANTNMKQGNR